MTFEQWLKALDESLVERGATFSSDDVSAANLRGDFDAGQAPEASAQSLIEYFQGADLGRSEPPELKVNPQWLGFLAKVFQNLAWFFLAEKVVRLAISLYWSMKMFTLAPDLTSSNYGGSSLGYAALRKDWLSFLTALFSSVIDIWLWWAALMAIGYLIPVLYGLYRRGLPTVNRR